MEIEIKKVSIKKEYEIVSAMMKALQESEKAMNDKSALWNDIQQNYMSHLIDAEQENEGTCLIAYVDKNVAGFLFGYTDEQDESRIETYTGKELYITDGFIYPDYRRLGIYQQMNKQIEEMYIAKGIRRITRFTLFTNKRMKGFLEKQGYTATRILYEKWLDEDGKNLLPPKMEEPD